MVEAYFRGLAHAHTVLSNHPGHRESNLTLREIAGYLRSMPDEPWEFVALAEHTSNPGKPRAMRGDEPQLVQLLQVPESAGDLKLIRGLEVSILPDGSLDAPDEYLERFELVIASRHQLARRVEKSPRAIAEHFEAAARHPAVDILGHPNRYIEDVKSVNWADIFAGAAASGTAIEVNLNIFPGWPRFGGARWISGEHARWREWLRLLAVSEAKVFIGSDVHQRSQLFRLIHEWERATNGHPKAHHDRLTRLTAMLAEVGIPPERVVSRSAASLNAWLATPKPQRVQLP